MDIGVNCNFPSKKVLDQVEKCQTQMCQKQKLLAEVSAKTAALERLANQDKAIRSGWQAAEKTCKDAVAAIERAMYGHGDGRGLEDSDKRRILVAVANALGGGGGEIEKVDGNCAALIGTTLEEGILQKIVMNYWKRKCSEKIREEIKQKASDSNGVMTEIKQIARNLHKTNVDFERAVDQISISSSVSSKYVIVINWLCERQCAIPAGLRTAMEREDGSKDDTYWQLFQNAWERLKCPTGTDVDDTATVNVSGTYWDHVVAAMDKQAGDNRRKKDQSGEVNHCKFYFAGGSSDRIRLKDDSSGTKIKAELTENGKQQVINIQVY